MRISYPNLQDSSRYTKIFSSLAGRIKGLPSPLYFFLPLSKWPSIATQSPRGEGR
jgi:hypothetical protein